MRTLLIAAAALFLSGCCLKNNNTNAVAGEEQTPATATKNGIGMIRLNVAVTTTPENLAEVVEGLNALAAASRAEAGCGGYDIFQNTVEPTKLIIVETWEGDDALSAHEKTPHFTTILPPLKEKMTLSVERFDY